MKVIIDRFEGSYAVCERENGNVMDVIIIDLPSGAKEGDVLCIDNDNRINPGVIAGVFYLKILRIIVVQRKSK